MIFLIFLVNGDEELKNIESEALAAEVDSLRLQLKARNENLKNDIKKVLEDEFEEINKKNDEKLTKLASLMELKFDEIKTSMEKNLKDFKSTQNIEFTAMTQNLSNLSEKFKLLDENIIKFGSNLDKSFFSVTSKLEEFTSMTQNLSSTVSTSCFPKNIINN